MQTTFLTFTEKIRTLLRSAVIAAVLLLIGGITAVYAQISNNVIDVTTLSGTVSYIEWSYDHSTNIITIVDNVSITGTATGAPVNRVLDIAAGKKATWTAVYGGMASGTDVLIDVTGDGELEIAGGSITISGGGYAAIQISGNSTLIVSGGTVDVGTSGAYAIVAVDNTILLTGTNTIAINGPGSPGTDCGPIYLQGANSVLRYERDNNLTVAGVISGAGSLEKDGTGTLTLGKSSFSGGLPNTYTGGSDLQKGTIFLAFGDGSGATSALGTGALIMADGTTFSTSASQAIIPNAITLMGAATFNVQATDFVRLSGVISGTGSLIMTGTNRLVLSGANTYAGNTTTSSSYTLIITGSLCGGNYNGNINLTGAISAIEFNQDHTLSGVISGSGDLIKRTASTTLTLSGDNTLTGNIYVFDGQLTVTGRLGGGTYGGNILVAGGTVLEFNQTADQTISGNITTGTPTGNMIKNGAGVLTLTGAGNTVTQTTVNGGTLQIGDGTTEGRIGNVTINTGGNLTLNYPSGGFAPGFQIDGSGTLTKAGSGTLNLFNTVSFTGLTEVREGTLVVNAANCFDASLAGGGLAMYGGTFNFSGNGGNLAIPELAVYTGSSTPTIDGGGDVALFNGGTLAYSLSAAVTNGATLLNLSGDADIMGANVTITVTAGSPLQEGDQITLIDATGTLTGLPANARITYGKYVFDLSVINTGSGDKLIANIPILTPPPPTFTPHISGPQSMTLAVGYAATTTGVYTITGTSPVTVSKASGDAAISWNATTKCLDIAAGLPAGEYPVVLRASNSAGSHSLIFTLTVENPVYYIDNPVTFPGGTVESDPQYLAEAGQTVTLTVHPDAGYQLESLSVTDYPNAQVTVALTGTGATRTFRMPAHHVSVAAVFSVTTGNDELTIDNRQLTIKAWITNGVLNIGGLKAGETWSVYNITGSLVYTGVVPDVGADLRVCPLPSRGIYIVRTGNKVLKVSY